MLSFLGLCSGGQAQGPIPSTCHEYPYTTWVQIRHMDPDLPLREAGAPWEHQHSTSVICYRNVLQVTV